MIMIIKDANGHFVPVNIGDLWEALQVNFVGILGMSLNSIIELRKMILEENYNPSNEKDVKLFIEGLKQKAKRK